MREEDRTAMEEALKDSGFYFQVMDGKTGQVLYGNLTDDSQEAYLKSSRQIYDPEEETAEMRYGTAIGRAYNEICYTYEENSGWLLPVPQTALGLGYVCQPYELYVVVDSLCYPVLEINRYESVNEIVYDEEQGLDAEYFGDVKYYVDEAELYTTGDLTTDELTAFHRTGGGQNMDDIYDSLAERGLFLVWKDSASGYIATDVYYDYDDSDTPQFYASFTLLEFQSLVDSNKLCTDLMIPEISDPASVVADSQDSYYMVYGTGDVAGVVTEYDELSSIYGSYGVFKSYLPWLIAGAAVCSILNLAAAVFLCLCIGGKRGEDGTVLLSRFERIPLDVVLLCGVIRENAL